MTAIPEAYYAIYDTETDVMRICRGFALGVYSNREDAERAARARGWKLPELGGPPEPPAAHASAAG
jgi:hypothetical protein